MDGCVEQSESRSGAERERKEKWREKVDWRREWQRDGGQSPERRGLATLARCMGGAPTDMSSAWRGRGRAEQDTKGRKIWEWKVGSSLDRREKGERCPSLRRCSSSIAMAGLL